MRLAEYSSYALQGAQGEMAETTTYDTEKEEMEKIFQTVAKKITRRWKWLGRRLKVSNAEIEEIEDAFRGQGQSEQAFQVLMKWLQMNGRNATKEVLYVALQEIGNQDVADVIKEHFNFVIDEVCCMHDRA